LKSRDRNPAASGARCDQRIAANAATNVSKSIPAAETITRLCTDGNRHALEASH
jgi:hypothetical protein